MTLKLRLRDWWRGFTNDDLRTLDYKLAQVRPPGSTIELTRAEYKALLYIDRTEGDSLRPAVKGPK